ncbi:MAG: epoxyqueuosine reductase QueH [Desulfosoma sp.]
MKPKDTKRILVHACCGPCLIYPLDFLVSEGWKVHAYFYNPHIQPYQEWQRRLKTARMVSASFDVPIIVREDYELEEFFRQTAFRENRRCLYCYSRRLEAAARLAKKSGFDAFTSTLLYSKRQNHDLVRHIGEQAASAFSIPFLYEDFRKGWAEGQQKAVAMGLYRQQYCGCVYSERDRFLPKTKERHA